MIGNRQIFIEHTVFRILFFFKELVYRISWSSCGLFNEIKRHRRVGRTWLLLCLLDRAPLWQLRNKRRTWCHLLFYFTSYVLNIFRSSIYPLSGACDYSVELPHWSCYSWFDVFLEFRCGWVGVISVLQAEAQLQHGYHSNQTTPKLQHTSNQEHTTNVVIQQNIPKLLMMDILTSWRRNYFF